MADTSEVHLAVRAAWADTLDGTGDDHRGDHQDGGQDGGQTFVSAGGHSLAAARLVARLRGELGVVVPLSALLRDDPTMDEFAAIVAAAGGSTAVTAATPPPPPVSPLSELPLAPSMRRIWTWHRLHPESPAYNVSRVLRIRGRIRPAALRAATADLAARHEALRCSVHEPRPGEPRLRVGDPAPVPVSVQVRAGTPEDPTAGVDEALHQVGAQPFALDAAPLWRIGAVYAPAADCTFLVLVIHHLVSDLRSSDQVLRELARAYEARGDGRTPEFAEPAPSLVGHIEHELSQVGTPGWRRDLDWWAQRLADVPTAAVAPLPFASAERDDGVYAAQTHTVDLDIAASAAIAAALRGRGTTPAIHFLTAAAAVVRAWAGGGPETVGIPSVRVARPVDHELVGFLLDTLPLTISAGRDETFADACVATRAAYVDAADHASPAFDDIVDRLRLRRAPGARSPLIRLWFSDMTQADMPARFGGAEAGEYDLPPAWSLFELGVYLRRTEADGFRLHIVVPRGRYPDAAVAALLAQIAQLAERAAAEPAATIGSLLAPHRAAGPVVGPDAHPDPGRSLPAAVAHHAAERPGAAALHDVDGELDYRSLDVLVREESRALRSATGAGAVVAVPARRDRLFVVRLLACRAAAITAVLVDAAWPSWRRARAADIAGVTHAYPETGDGPPAATGRPGLDPERPPGHVLFTSGTTGDPLAVAVSSDVADAALADVAGLLGATAADRVSMLSGAAHDPVLREVGLAFGSGATLCIPPPESSGTPDRLATWLREQRVTVVNGTPALLGLVFGGMAAPLPDLRTVVCGGSVLSAHNAAVIRAGAPQAAIVNGYGCTETPQLVTAHVLPPGADLPATPDVPIGTAVAARRVELRAEDGRPCGVGQVGELWVAAPHVAEGYVGGGPARFVTDGTGERWLRTGDLARLDAAGVLHLGGRTDRQVLVGGHRVTLDEIESAARGYPGVADALAQTVGGGGESSVRVWAQRAPGHPVTDVSVRAHLASVLPSGVLPARVIVVDRLELGPNGKPVAPAPGPAPAPAHVDADLRRLAESVLGRPLDPEANFFDAGFTSVSLVQLSAEIGELLGRPVEALTLFQHPNLSMLGTFLVGGTGPVPVGAQARDVHAGPRDRRREIRALIRSSLAADTSPPA